jgi:uncharacterized damage-inducible protein DinB
MTIDEAIELFSYASWATARTCRAAEALTDEQREAVAPSSFPSLTATLAHLVSAEWIWLRRWLGDSPTSLPPWTERPTFQAVTAQLAAIEAERATWLATQTDADLTRVISYHALDGQPFAHPLGKLMRHVVNHSTYHRGQMATQLRQLGQTPPNTDFTRFLREATA